MPQLRMVVAGLSPLRSGSDPRANHVGLVEGEVHWGQVFLRVLFFWGPVIAIPQMRHTQSSIYHRRYRNLLVDSIVNSTLQKESSDLVIQRVSHLFRSVFTPLVITGALCNGPVF